MDLRIQGVEFRGGEKVGEGDIEAVAEELDGQQLWVAAFAVEDILDARRRQRAECCQLVHADVPLPAKLENSIFHRSYCIHGPFPP